MKHCTNLEQSRKLLKLGLSKESCDMYIGNYVGKSRIVDGTNTHYFVRGESFGAPEIIPCWSVGALLDIMPDTIEDKYGVTFGLNIKKKYVEYFNPSMGALYSIYHSVISDTTLDAAFEMVVWLLENGYIKTNK